MMTVWPTALAPTMACFVVKETPGLPSGSVPVSAVPAGTTMILEESGKPNSSVRPLTIEPSLAFRLMPVQACA